MVALLLMDPECVRIHCVCGASKETTECTSILFHREVT